MTQLAAAPGFRWVCAGCRRFNDAGLSSCAGCGAGWAVAAPAARRQWRALPMLLEAGLLAGLFLLWRVVGSLSGAGQAGAVARGRWLWALERAMHLPNEAAVQALVLGHPDLVRALNVFYLAAHVASMAAFLPWLYLRHRDAYPAWRNMVAVFTGACLAIGFLPVAPPRLISGIGIVDTGRIYHESAYGPVASRFTDSLSSMPSVHIGWAVLIAVAVISVSRSRWRWLVLAHPVATVFTVVATGNHFWLDGVGAVAVLALALLARRRIGPRSRPDRGSSEPALLPMGS